jgi:hypothetical protein
MRFPALLLLALAACAPTHAAPSAASGPVVIELFTSQGCSSCPPADRLLAALGEDPAVLPLAFHVDYWDHLGWRDPFSSPRWSERQGRYAKGFGRGLYTPQLVVGGTQDVLGSHARAARAAIDRAASRPPSGATVELAARRDGRRIVASGEARAPAPATLVVVLYERARTTDVPRGENAGTRAADSYVVRELVERPLGPFSVELPLASDGAHGVVAFIQAASGGAILAARRAQP